MKADPGQFFVLVMLPVLMITALTPMALAVLRMKGYSNANGAEQSVPGMAVLFSFTSTTILGGSFFREHHWNTWERLRASPALPFEIILGKCGPVFVLSMCQLSIVWCVGILAFHLHISGSLFTIAILTGFLSWATLGIGMALVALCRTIDQIGIIGNIGSMVLGGLSGAFVPIDLHSSSGMVARFSPLFWALKAYQSVIFEGKGILDNGFACLLLFGFGTVGFLVGAARFRMADAKIGRT
jgi:ABC-2 type transport system permease protein